MYGKIIKLYKVTFVFTGKYLFNFFNTHINLEHLIGIFLNGHPSVGFLYKVTPITLHFWTLSFTVSSILRRRLFTCLFPNLCTKYLDFFRQFTDSFIVLMSIFK